MEIDSFGDAVRHWRNKKYNITGEIDENGNVSVFPGPHRPKFPPKGNGRGEEDPLKAVVVYQTPQTERVDA